MRALKNQWNSLAEVIANWMRGSEQDPHALVNGSSQERLARVASHGDRKAPRILASLLILTAILMLIFVAAATVVRTLDNQHPRLLHASAEHKAAAEYRKARSACQSLSGGAREGCIADAHSSEARARAVSTILQRDYVSVLRQQTDAAIVAADKDSIIVEPACNLVARGLGSLCEIQVKPNAGNLAVTNLIPANVTAPQFAAVNPPKMIRAQFREPAQPTPARQFIERVETYPQPRAQLFELAWSSRQ